MSTDCECIVIGAGVIGLAIAAELASMGTEVVLLEREAAFGTMTSARNSEVIHAGIYYAADSLKARLCVEGRQALYRYCDEHGVEHARVGKLIVATSDAQVAQLASIRTRAMVNGVEDIRALDRHEAQAMEPELHCLAALHSPSTGIIDSHGLMLSLLGDAERHGAVLATRSPVSRITRDPSTGILDVEVSGEDALVLKARYVINAAGHGACALAATALVGSVAGNAADTATATDSRDDSASVSASRAHQATHCDMPDSRLLPEPVLSKGNYFRLTGSAPFSRLIYPVPEEGGLGVHVTIDLGGQARFGPDVQPIEVENYEVDPGRSERFYAAIRQYWPNLQAGALQPDYAGIRPKIRFGDTLYADFLIQSKREHGLPGLINLFGIESPGLTASLAIAREVAARLYND